MDGESILGTVGDESDDKKNIVLKPPTNKVQRKPPTKPTKKPPKKAKRIASPIADKDEDIKVEDTEDAAPSTPAPKRNRSNTKPPAAPPMVSIAMPSTSCKTPKPLTAKDMKEFSIPLLTLKIPNQRERKREIDVQKQKKRYEW